MFKEVVKAVKSLFVKGSFAQNVAFMSGSSVWNMVIQMIFFPILTRIYPPESYGIFAIYNGIVVTLSQFMTLGYHRALVLPKKDSEFKALLRLSLRTLGISVLTLSFIGFIGADFVAAKFDLQSVKIWVYFIAPIAAVLCMD
ncbi:MAG: oligosaccharide flippase family protein, partial [Bacteroidota bacterium]